MAMVAMFSHVVLFHLSMAVTQPEFECTARHLALSQATNLLGKGPHLVDVAAALRMSECPRKQTFVSQRTDNVDDQVISDVVTGKNGAKSRLAITMYVSISGSDDGDGSAEHPFLTLHKAVAAARASEAKPVTIVVRPGRYPQTSELTLTPEDNGLTIEAETPGTVVLSGAFAFSLTFVRLSAAEANSIGVANGTMKASLPQDVDVDSIVSLFEDTDSLQPKLGESKKSSSSPTLNFLHQQ